MYIYLFLVGLGKRGNLWNIKVDVINYNQIIESNYPQLFGRIWFRFVLPDLWILFCFRVKCFKIPPRSCFGWILMLVIIFYCRALIINIRNILSIYITWMTEGPFKPHGWPKILHTYTLFFIRTKLIRTPSLKFDEILRTFWTLKYPSIFSCS